jgi:hypothetical protein
MSAMAFQLGTRGWNNPFSPLQLTHLPAALADTTLEHSCLQAERGARPRAAPEKNQV